MNTRVLEKFECIDNQSLANFKGGDKRFDCAVGAFVGGSLGGPIGFAGGFMAGAASFCL